MVLSFFSEYLANHRAIVVSYEGKWYFPTWKFLPMATFGQEDEFGANDTEANYRAMAEQFRATRNWVIMPPIPFNPTENDLDFYTESPPHPPDARHLLGTDGQGRDILARLLYGFRLSILFALTVTILSMSLGVVVGCLQGYIGGRFDLISQRFVEVWSTLPDLYIIILMGVFFKPSFGLLTTCLVLFAWIGITYYMRAEMYREKAREYALAARAMGAGPLRIVFVHLLPNCLTPIVTLAPFAIIGGIFSLTALDFLGYGLPAPTPSWGELIEQAIDSSNRGKMWLVISPFAAIVVTLTLVTLIGESIREAFDPRQYSRYR